MTRIARSWVAVMLACLPTWAQAQSAIDAQAVGEVETYLARLEKLGFSGVLVATQGGLPVIAQGFGLADRERGVPWSLGTVSTIGSITKQFTGAAILLLAEEGKLSVTDPISKHFEDVPDDKKAITLHQLLTHSSGIVDLVGFGDWDPIDRDELVQRALEQELAFSPGEGYEYSNAGYSLLGAVIEQLTHQSYEQFVRQRLFAPQGLYETGYLHAAWGKGRLAQGYRDGERWGTVLERPLAEDGPHWVLRANGGIHSTPWDMVRWGQALLDGRVMSAASREQYWAPHVDEGGGESYYGYGWVVMNAGGAQVIMHNGSNTIFYADMAIVPQMEGILLFMTNVVADWSVGRELLGQVGYRLLMGRPLPSVPELIDVERATLEPYAGSYELTDEAATGRLGVALAQRDGGEWELVVEPQDTTSFGQLLSTRAWERKRAERLSGRIDGLVEAMVAGDLSPLARAYRGQVTAEYLAGRWAEERQRLEEAHGAFEGHRVLGTAFRHGRDVTLVRLRFAHGEVERAYVWDPETEEELQGVSRQGLGSRLHVLPEPEGRFATWDPRTSESRQIRFERLEDGGHRLIIGDDPRIVATPRGGKDARSFPRRPIGGDYPAADEQHRLELDNRLGFRGTARPPTAGKR